METIKDFCKWAGSQRKAAQFLGLKEPHMSQIVNGKAPLTRELCERCETVSGGLFRKESLMWPTTKKD